MTDDVSKCSGFQRCYNKWLMYMNINNRWNSRPGNRGVKERDKPGLMVSSLFHADTLGVKFITHDQCSLYMGKK